jgi:hypothetical protein
MYFERKVISYGQERKYRKRVMRLNMIPHNHKLRFT